MRQKHSEAEYNPIPEVCIPVWLASSVSQVGTTYIPVLPVTFLQFIKFGY